MAGSIGLPVIDTMIGFPRADFTQYDFIKKQTKDADSRENMEFPVEYMFKQVPKDLPTNDPVAVTLHEMDRFGIEKGLIVVSDENSRLALKHHPDRFVPSGAIARSQRRRRVGACDPKRARGIRDPCDVGVPVRDVPAGADR